MAFVRFGGWLDEISRNGGPLASVVFEEARAHAGTLAAQVYGGFLAHLTAWCERKSVPYLGGPVTTIKRHATGKGNAPTEVVVAATATGFFRRGRPRKRGSIGRIGRPTCATSWTRCRHRIPRDGSCLCRAPNSARPRPAITGSATASMRRRDRSWRSSRRRNSPSGCRNNGSSR